jgi:hypothetical protein
VSVFLCVLLSCVSVEALRRADHPSKESYQMCNRFTSKNTSTPEGKRGRLRKKQLSVPVAYRSSSRVSGFCLMKYWLLKYMFWCQCISSSSGSYSVCDKFRINF